MDKIKTAFLQANNFFNTADHLAYVSYPLLKDNKLFLVIINNLYMSSLKCIDVMLYNERLYKRVGALPDDVDSRIILLETEIAPRAKMNTNLLKIIKDLRFVVKQHKESPVEFSRMGKFVICNNDYSIVKTIDIEIVKSYILNVRQLLHFVGEFVKNV